MIAFHHPSKRSPSLLMMKSEHPQWCGVGCHLPGSGGIPTGLLNISIYVYSDLYSCPYFFIFIYMVLYMVVYIYIIVHTMFWQTSCQLVKQFDHRPRVVFGDVQCSIIKHSHTVSELCICEVVIPP